MKIKLSKQLEKSLKSLNNEAVDLLLKNNRKESLSPNPITLIENVLDLEGNNERGVIKCTKEDGRILKIRLSRVFKHVFNKDFTHPSLNANAIEKANNDFISISNSHVFKVAKEVAYWYEDYRYYGYDTDIQHDRVGTLWKSCMRNNMHNCGNFFTENQSIKVLLKMKDGLVVGRALLWENVKSHNDDKINFSFMDRIYTVFDHDIKAFEDWAIDNGYWRKEYQNYQDVNLFIDDKGERRTIDSAYTEIQNYNPYGRMEKGIPYFDTFCYVNNNNTVSNDMNLHSTYEARDPEGLKIELHTVRHLLSDNFYNSNFLRYIASINQYAKDSECTWVDLDNKYFLNEDVIHIDGTAYNKETVERVGLDNFKKLHNLLTEQLDKDKREYNY